MLIGIIASNVQRPQGGYTLDNFQYDSLSISPYQGDLSSQTEVQGITVQNNEVWVVCRDLVGKFSYDSSDITNWTQSVGDSASLSPLSVGSRYMSNFRFNSTGTKGISCRLNDYVYYLSFSAAWDITSVSTTKSADLSHATIRDVWFNSDATKAFFASDDPAPNFKIARYTANLTSQTLSNDSNELGSLNSAESLCMDPTGTILLTLDASNDTIREYSLSTAWDLSSASFIQSVSVTSQDTGPVSITYNHDGTKLYMVGKGGTDAIYQYSL